jgi:peptide/nickel transport system ATP-binding protein
MSDTNDPVVTIEDVEVHFKSSASFIDGLLSNVEQVKAVDGVSLEIPEKQVVALVGESGCGKTTLGKTAIGAQRPTGGSVKYRGHDIWDVRDGNSDADITWQEIRRSLQIIHQDPGSSLNPNQKVKKTLEAPLKRHYTDLNIEDRQARIHGLLDMVGMSPPEDYASRYPHQLSGGEQQRIALIRALLMNPDLILADEAISALDVSLRIEMMDLFLELQDIFNTSFVFISHDLSNAWYLTEKADGLIGIMYLGKLVEIGLARQILENPQHPYTKALMWATPDLSMGDSDEELPLKTIDIPDPIDPPTGCRFHTRCPEAREVCTGEEPTLDVVSEDGSRRHKAACYRLYDDHEYWDSDPLPEETRLSDPEDVQDAGTVSDD